MQTPTKYVHKHFKPAEFSTGACVLKKEVTKASEKVLYRYAHDLGGWACSESSWLDWRVVPRHGKGPSLS